MTIAIVEYSNTSFVIDADGMNAASAAKAEAALSAAASDASATLAGHYANDDTDTDVTGGSVGDRGAKYWADEAETAKTGSVAAQALSEAAADAAESINSGMDFASFAAGVSGTTAGQVFYVVVNGYRQFYKNGTSADADDIYYYTGPQYAADTTALLLATTRAFSEGDTINTANGYAYVVAASAATDHHLTTAGGVKLYLLPAGDGRYHTRGFGIEPSADNKAEFTAFFLAFSGKPVLINYALAQYRANYITIETNTNVLIEPGVYIKGLDAGEATVFRSKLDATDFQISGYGATIELPASDVSHALNFGNAPKRVLVEGLTIIGPGLPNISESDCIYIGGQPDDDNVAEDIIFRDVVARNARRNILSIVACRGALFENCSLSGTLVGGTLRRIVDIEPNRWLANGGFSVEDITFRNCRMYDSADGGFLCTGAKGVLLDNCQIYDTLKMGAQVSQWSNIFNPDRNARVGDRLGVVSIDSATGWITVATTANITDDYGIRPGMWMTRILQNSGTLPTEMNAAYLVIEDVSADQKQIRVSQEWGYGLVTSTTGTGSAGTGSYSADPDISSVGFGVYRWDDDVTLKNVHIFDVGEECFRVTVSSKITVDGGLFETSSASLALNYIYTRNPKLTGSLTVLGSTTSGKGLQFDKCSECGVGDAVVIRGFPKAGITILSSSGTNIGKTLVQDCGPSDSAVGGGCAINISKSTRVTLSPKLRMSLAAAPDRGIYFATSTSDCLVDGADGYTAGSTNSKTFSTSGNYTNRIINSKVKDGTWSPTLTSEGITGYNTNGNSAATLTATVSPITQSWITTLTADKAVTLSTTGAATGSRFRISRPAGGAFNLNVGTGPLKALPANSWCEVIYNGSAWVLSQYGTL
jgi:hypothetical protein